MNDRIPENNDDGQGDGKRTHFYIALGAFAVGLIMFVLAFCIKGAGTYLLFGSMLCELAGVSFLNAQKKHDYFTACKALRVACYVVMCAALAVVLVGISLVFGGGGE